MITILIIWRIYAVITVLLLLNSISQFLFTRKKNWERIRLTIKSMLFCVIWPITLFSTNGWQTLTNRMKDV